ncbi:methyltransferase type 11 [Mycobacterium sp. 1465703.0]|uniref:methyltransferase type 11 n=1 Tax=Mycobacterium sp. 1465703.0 TaxID=1834078 RepID=UPI000AB7B91C|nr:methyltransferase type 11 [Mycobacterium sp. 1465703.0]
MTTTSPVIFMIFNRPDTARQAFESIRAARPQKLFVIADGPRANRPEEAEKCEATRAIIDEVDWECDVHRNFAEANMGIRDRISSGITWAFEQVDRAIILEDDCVPSPSFFPYCAELLDRYEEDERVMMISGNNHLFGHAETADSYYFSRYPHYWGWATWRRAWEKYDMNMTQWPAIRDRKLFDQYFSKMTERYYWEAILEMVYRDKVDTWAWRWVYSIWANSGLCATPARNLVHNVGFAADATHTHTKWDRVYSALTAEELTSPLTHPATVLANFDLDSLEARLRVAYHSTGLLYIWDRLQVLKTLVRRARRRIQNRPTAYHEGPLARRRANYDLPETRESA